jgi:6,7-dimethyl-8-ribityllumazine synthase
MAFSGKYDALVCLGAVIRGETAHFEHIASEVTRGIGSVTRESKIPIAFGVDDLQHGAAQRAGNEMENKGFERRWWRSRWPT